MKMIHQMVKSLVFIICHILIIVFLSNCTKKPSGENPPPPPPTCNLQITPQTATIDAATGSAINKQTFTATGDNAGTTNWTINNEQCASIDVSSGVSTTAIAVSKETCQAVLTATTTSPECYATAVLNVQAELPPVCNLNQIIPDNAPIEWDSAGGTIPLIAANKNGDSYENVIWSVTPNISGCNADIDIPQGKSHVNISGSNQSTTDECIVTVKVQEQGKNQCTVIKHNPIKIKPAVPPPDCNLSKINLSNSSVDSGSSITANALDKGTKDIAVDWSIIDQSDTCSAEVQSLHSSKTLITGHNTEVNSCNITIKAQEPGKILCTATNELTIKGLPCDLNIQPQNPTMPSEQSSVSFTVSGSSASGSLEWTSDHPSCATISASGVASRAQDVKSECKTLISAKNTLGCNASTTLTVEPPSSPDCNFQIIGPTQVFTGDRKQFSVTGDTSVQWTTDHSNGDSECFAQVQKPSPTSANIYFQSANGCNVNIYAKKNESCSKSLSVQIQLHSENEDQLTLSVVSASPPYILAALATHTAPNCNALPMPNSCLKLSLSNDSKNSYTAYPGIPNFSPESGVLHVQMSAANDACSFSPDPLKPDPNIILPPNRTCSFFAYVQSDTPQSSDTTHIVLPYKYGEGLRLATLDSPIQYKVDAPKYGRLCVKIDNSKAGDLDPASFDTHPLKTAPYIDTVFHFSNDFNSPSCLDHVITGQYTIIAPTISTAQLTYQPDHIIQTVTVNEDSDATATFSYSTGQTDPNTGLLCIQITDHADLNPSDFNSSSFAIRPNVSGFLFKDNSYKACVRVLDTNYNIVAQPIFANDKWYKPSPSDKSITVLPGGTEQNNLVTFTYSVDPNPQTIIPSNWSIYGAPPEDSVLWDAPLTSSGYDNWENQQGLSDAFEEIKKHPDAWTAMIDDMKGKDGKGVFKNALPKIVSYSYFDRTLTQNLIPDSGPFPINANCSYIQRGTPQAVAAKCTLVYDIFDTQGNKKTSQANQCYILFRTNDTPQFCYGDNFHLDDLTCRDNQGKNIWNNNGCFYPNLQQVSGKDPVPIPGAAADWCVLDPRGGNLFWCKRWTPNIIDLRTVPNLQLVNSDKTPFACASPGVKLIAQTKWGGLGIGKDILRYDPSIALNDIRYTAVAGENLDPVFMYKNPLSDYQLVRQQPIQGFGYFDPEDTKIIRAFLGLCDNHQGFCLPNGLTATPQLALAHIFGRSGPMINSEYAKYVKKNAPGFYTWQYDDGDSLLQCHSAETKLVLYICGDTAKNDSGLYPQYDKKDILPLIGKSRLMVVNNCSETIWVQQTLRPQVKDDPPITRDAKNYLVELAPRTNHTSYDPADNQSIAIYDTPDSGLQSFRLWAKRGCTDVSVKDHYARNCIVGNTGPDDDPEHLGLLQPDAQTIFEATFGCFNGAKCVHLPNNAPIGPGIWYDLSTVDGFTFKASLQMIGEGEDPTQCKSIDTPKFDINACPSNVDLSTIPGT